jgi:hypothetical protein
MSRILGSMRRLDQKRGAVRVEDVYDTDITDLWSAITEPHRLAGWIATVEGDLKVGGTVQTRFTSTWEGPGRIDVCDPPHHLVVTMEPETEDEAVIEAVLTAEGERQSGTWSCGDQKTYSGQDFALSNQSCDTGQFVNGIDTTGNTQCAKDQTYSGADFALSNHSCSTGMFVTGVSSTGLPTCSTPTTQSLTEIKVEGQDTCDEQKGESCGAEANCGAGFYAAVGGYELSFTGTPGVPSVYINQPELNGHAWEVAASFATPGDGTMTLTVTAFCWRLSS